MSEIPLRFILREGKKILQYYKTTAVYASYNDVDTFVGPSSILMKLVYKWTDVPLVEESSEENI